MIENKHLIDNMRMRVFAGLVVVNKPSTSQCRAGCTKALIASPLFALAESQGGQPDHPGRLSRLGWDDQQVLGWTTALDNK